jgi:hypothetical protein
VGVLLKEHLEIMVRMAQVKLVVVAVAVVVEVVQVDLMVVMAVLVVEAVEEAVVLQVLLEEVRVRGVLVVVVRFVYILGKLIKAHGNK